MTGGRGWDGLGWEEGLGVGDLRTCDMIGQMIGQTA
jgi:hypothetical protein